MEMGFNLNLEQSQKLVMTPQLRQAIKILQFTSLELEEYIEQQIENNPIIEINEEDKKTKEELIEDKKIDWKEYAEDFDNYEYCKEAFHHNSDNDFNYENIIFRNPTLQEHLIFQFTLTYLEADLHLIGEYIIDSLDENGYLRVSLEEIAETLQQDYSTVESVLHIIQTFEPVGVAARTLTECLVIQCKSLGIKNENVYLMIESYLDEIACNKYPAIAKSLGITTQEVQNICDFLKTLEPKPGRKYAGNDNRYVVPDVVIKKIENEYYIIPNDRNIPRLTIRKDYQQMLSRGDENEEAVRFLNDKFNNAMWLIKSIEQRMQTIHKVVEQIVHKQRCFFEHGKKHLKPMTLREIADEIGVHESTVSRATNGKYVETPAGTFELKYFFSSGVPNNGGESIAAESIKNYIRDILDHEDPKKPYSDDRIASELESKGIKISRRTVAKYREDMKIPSSSKRKRY
ncbi:RNA polymerase factor sigma-54 [Tindallia californiensis]|uniref:RNA polymerase, sigma 54 subunit, RpoN/SigL n=1 Tax=Tindallia californiensis TaxID=159292 RepID=A0A1H3I997_9FIRM|nr:RNA polymerase factor sigma-54 [Tindallia californiensis]SDY24055.1 RNA polymerase, sigma 54 subunit, RpoN/SigL [Tindallia californiensis]